MSSSLKKQIVWLLVAIALFSVFHWLFRLALPGAALQFSVGITIIIMAGLLSGNYGAKLFYKYPNHKVNIILFLFVALTLLCLLLLGWLVNRMIGDTRFHHFFFTVLTLFLACSFLASIISLIRDRIKNNILTAQTALAQSKTELQLLQSQMSPHFLFNTLNNLYGLSISEPSKVPGLILKLSELLRYSVYEAKEVFVPLLDEINYLKNYIEFEKMRLGGRLSLTSQFEDMTDRSLMIAPMLLIVFVENAFKHSKDNEDEKIFIWITLKVEGTSINFSVKNSCSTFQSSSEKRKSYSGLGLESVKRRLALLYMDKHDLKIAHTEKTFSINLELEANHV